MLPVFPLIALIPLGLFLTEAPANTPTTTYALWALVITTLGGLVKGYMDNKASFKLRQLDYEERLKMHAELKRNTDLTQKAVVEAQSAYHEANNVNVKIANLHDVQKQLLLEGSPVEQASRIAALSDYVHKRIHDMAGHVMTIGDKVNK